MDMLDALIRQSGRYRRNLLGTLRVPGTATTSRGHPVKPSRLEDRGAVAVEFVLLLPVQVLMFAGIFGLGAAMIQERQLNCVVDAAAFRGDDRGRSDIGECPVTAAGGVRPQPDAKVQCPGRRPMANQSGHATAADIVGTGLLPKFTLACHGQPASHS